MILVLVLFVILRVSILIGTSIDSFLGQRCLILRSTFTILVSIVFLSILLGWRQLLLLLSFALKGDCTS